MEQTEKFAREILWALEKSLKAVGNHPHRQGTRSTSWWTFECKIAHIDYQQAMEDSERTARARTLRKTVLSAKREHWKQHKVEEMKLFCDMYKLMRWAALIQANKTPPQ